MSDERDARATQEFEQFWDALVTGRAVPPSDLLDPSMTEVAQHLRHLGQPIEVDRRFANQLEEDLMSTAALAATVPLPSPSIPLNGRSPRVHGAALSSPKRRPSLRTAVSWASGALLLVLVAGLLYVWLEPELHRASTPRILAPATPVPQPGSDAPWPTYRGNAGRTAAVEAPGPVAQPAERWRSELGAPAKNAPIAADGMLFISTDDGVVHAISGSDGTEEWSITPSSPPKGSLAYIDGMVLVLDDADALSAYDARTGEMRWTLPDLGGIGPGPVVDGVMYGVAGNGDVFALVLSDQTVHWRVPIGAGEARQIAAADGRLHVAGGDGVLTTLDAANGALLWETQKGGTLATPVARNGIVVTYNIDGGEVIPTAYDAETGRIIWSQPTDHIDFRPVSMSATAIYLSNDVGTIDVVELATKDLQNLAHPCDAIVGGTVLAGELLYAACSDGNLVALDLTNGSEAWRYGVGTTEFGPVIAWQTLFIVSETGDLIALGE